MTLLRNVLVFLTIFTPVIAFIVWNIELRGRHWYLIAAAFLEMATVYLAYHPLRLSKLTPWMHYYTLFLMVYLLVIGFKYNYDQFNRALAIGMFTLFIAGDLWEIPIFIYDFLGKLGIMSNSWTHTLIDTKWIFSHVRRIYTAASAHLFFLVTGVRFDRKSYIILFTSLGLAFLLLLPVGMNRARSLFKLGTTVTRIVFFSLFGYAVWYGVDMEK